MLVFTIKRAHYLTALWAGVSFFLLKEKAMQDKPENDHKLYFDITAQERDSAIRYLLGSILNCRKDSEFPSNKLVFDEDVNVYMAHLLFAVSLPEYHDMAEPYLSLDTSDIVNWVKGTEDKTIRYFIFKVNADHILIHTAIFDDIENKKQKLFKKSQKHYRELAQLYYDQAALYHARIYRKKTGVGEVLEKLSKYFDSYQGLLRQVRRDYFGFVNNFRDQAFSSFVGEISSYECNAGKQEKIDMLLDLYGQWLKNKDIETRMKIQGLVERIKSMDKNFQFDLEKQLGGGHYNERKCA